MTRSSLHANQNKLRQSYLFERVIQKRAERGIPR
jgi:hypothetical protein